MELTKEDAERIGVFQKRIKDYSERILKLEGEINEYINSNKKFMKEIVERYRDLDDQRYAEEELKKLDRSLIREKIDIANSYFNREMQVISLKQTIGEERYEVLYNSIKQLNNSEEIALKATEILLKTGVHQGELRKCKPKIDVAAAHYIASVLLRERRTQEEVAKACEITSVSLRSRYKEFATLLDIEITI